MKASKNSRPTLLITGASGLLGEALCRAAVARWAVYGTYLRHPVRVKKVQPVRVDLTRQGETGALLAALQPGALIHAAAEADTAICQSAPERTARINTRVPAFLAAWCRQRDVPFGFISTDLVFAGDRAPYAEDSPGDPRCVYGRQKVLAERAVMAQYARAAIFRLPLMIGLSSRPSAQDRHFCRRMLEAIAAGRDLDLFTDEYRTPVDIDSAANGILALIGRADGIVHLGGRTRISRYDLGLQMATAMQRPTHHIRAVTLAESPSTVPRARDVSLDSRRAFNLGYAPAALETAIQRIVSQFIVISEC